MLTTPGRKSRLLSGIAGAGVIALGLILTTDTDATIYKWVDEQGRVSFSDQPRNENAQVVDIRYSQPGNRGETKNTQSERNRQHTTQSGTRQQEQPTGEKQVPVLSQKEKRARCQDARQRLSAITARNRVRERDDKGNLRYLSEKERQQRLQAAQKNIRKYCR